MFIVKVIPAKRWRNLSSNATASLYGAVPYLTETDKANWVIEHCGYTWLTEAGTVGIGRVPASTDYDDHVAIELDSAEAIRLADKLQQKYIYHTDEDNV